MRKFIIARLAFCSLLIYVVLYSFSIHASEEPSINEINKLRNTEIKSAEYYFNQGLSYSDLGNYDQAIFYYDQAIKKNPEYTMAYNNRGNVFCRMGNYEKAIIDYNRAIDFNPSFAEAFNNRAYAYYYTWEFEKALGDANKAQGFGVKVHQGLVNILHQISDEED